MSPDDSVPGTCTQYTIANPQSIGDSTSRCTTRSIEMRIAMAHLIVEQEIEEQRVHEPCFPTWWMYQCRQYDRINANREYLRQFAKAKRHFNQKRFRKLGRKKIRRCAR